MDQRLEEDLTSTFETTLTSTKIPTPILDILIVLHLVTAMAVVTPELFLQVHTHLHLMKLKFIIMFNISRELHVIFIIINSEM